MKIKATLLTLALLAAATSSFAQRHERNILGFRAGINAASLNAKGLLNNDGATSRTAKIGWHVGFTDQILLTRSVPFYLEVGAMLSNKGSGTRLKVNSVRYKERYGVTYLQIPMRVNYHVRLGDVTLEPYFGFYYACGLWGRHVEATRGGSSTERHVTRMNFGDDFSRSDFGISLGLGWSYSKYYTAIGWERGFVNMSKIDGTKFINSSNFMITVGRNF